MDRPIGGQVGVFEQVMDSLGLTPRPQQSALLVAARGAQPGHPVFAQAGTGTGKSFVVLSCAVEHAKANRRPSVVVCPTNALVDQYVHKDAPQVAAATGGTFTHIKGRSHYLCSSSKALRESGDGLARWRALVQRHRVHEVAPMGLDGAQYGCPGSKLCDGVGCGAQVARAEAASYDVVITNAHVLMWDRRVWQFTSGAKGLLPPYGALFVDECHEMEPAARGCLSDEMGPGSEVFRRIPQFGDWVRLATRDLDEEIEFRPDDTLLRLRHRVEQDLVNLATDMSILVEGDEYDRVAVSRLQREINALQRFLDLFVRVDDDGCKFLPILTPERTVRRACIDASDLSGAVLRRGPSVLVSGTVPRSLPRRLGAPDSGILNVGHPFDYSNSTLVISRYDPRVTSHRASRIDGLVRAIRDTGGGTLVLFTSWQDLDEIMQAVYAKLDALGLADKHPVFLQSKDDPADTRDMIDQFKQHGNAVLAGVRTLFTGIDIPGPALRQVVIWKLPYRVPSLELAAIEAVHGRQVYWDDMLVSLTQGIGRLVRKADDWGRVLILDSRAATQHWTASGLTAHLAEFSARGPVPGPLDTQSPALVGSPQ